MNRQRKECIEGWMISGLLGIVAWLFFGIFYRHHLHYQEQLQLFLLTSDYLSEVMSVPGGLAIYIGRFLTQFYQDSMQGALGIAVLLVALQRLVTDAFSFVARKPLYGMLGCLPAVALWAVLCDENVLLSAAVAPVISLLAVAFYNRITSEKMRIIYLLCMTPAVYLLAGLAGFIFPALSLLIEWMRPKKDTSVWVYVTVGTVLLGILSPLTAKAVLLQYPLSRLVWAGDYYRFVSLHPAPLFGVYLLIVWLPVVFRWLPEVAGEGEEISASKAGKSKRRMAILLQFVLIAGGGYIGISQFADWKKEEVMAYDYYARTRKWNQILALADRRSPDGPLTVSLLNLALCQKGLLPDEMFSYFQNGPEGLLPAFERNFTLPLMAGEIYYHLGLVNTAQRFAFEGMESIPDHQKSVRCIKRLAETNLINGEYAVAAKYLKILQHTIFYRSWAKEAEAYLGDEARIRSHPEWGKLRNLRPKEDFLFSEREKDMILGMLFQENGENRMAYEYLLAYALLTKDLQRFLSYYRLGERVLPYTVIPKSYQEALLYIWNLTHTDPTDSIPYPIDPSVKQRLAAYMQLYAQGPAAEPLLRQSYGDTYWYYLHFRRN